MEQYYRLFSSYRLPGIEKDKLIDSSELCNCLEDEQAEHIIVISLNQIFVLDVVFNLVRLTEEQVYQQLKRIKRQSEEDLNTSNAHADVGFLTSLPRDKWAQARCELIKGKIFCFLLRIP
jgi:choline O-acetyltransferase